MNNYAFPNDSFGGNGLTKREYFAAHAPAEPAPWFVPVLRDCPDGPDTAVLAWRAECRKQRDIQWPWAWADAVLGGAR